MWGISFHATRRYVERFEPGLTDDEAREELEYISEHATYLRRSNGAGHYGSYLAPRAVFVVSDGVRPGQNGTGTLMTVYEAAHAGANARGGAWTPDSPNHGNPVLQILREESMRRRIEVDEKDCLDPLSWVVLACVIAERMRSGVQSAKLLSEAAREARRPYTGKLTGVRIARLSAFTEAVGRVTEDAVRSLHDPEIVGGPDVLAAVNLLACHAALSDSSSRNLSRLAELCEITALELVGQMAGGKSAVSTGEGVLR